MLYKVGDYITISNPTEMFMDDLLGKRMKVTSVDEYHVTSDTETSIGEFPFRRSEISLVNQWVIGNTYTLRNGQEWLCIHIDNGCPILYNGIVAHVYSQDGTAPDRDSRYDVV